MDLFQSKITKAFAAIASVITLLFSAMAVNDSVVEENYARQDAHMNYLVNEYYVDYTPCDESKIACYDIQKAIDDGVKYNEISFIGTHNSYQLESTPEYKALYNAVSDMTFGIVDGSLTSFNMDSLTDQLQLGLRSLELDIETVTANGETSFVVSHSPLLDITSSCYDFETALTEIKMWSDANPGHLPVTVIIEPKKGVLPVNGMKNFSLKYANEFDSLLREILGDTLLTPAEMMGDYDSFKAMREDDGWLALGETMGKVLVLLHDTTVTDSYINQDVSVKSQAMFPMLRYADRNKSYASFIIDNTPSDALKHKEELIDKCNLIVRTRADSYTSFSETEYEAAINSGAQIVSTDYPVKVQKTNQHEFTFDGCYLTVINK